MLIRLGYDIQFDVPAPVAMIAMLHVHPSRIADLREPDELRLTPSAPVDMYRDSPLFRQLHDPSQFQDRCGVCDYKTLCGGSRARAFAATGNPLASDPICTFAAS